MAKNLKNINGRFVESDFENALIAFIEEKDGSTPMATTYPEPTEKKCSAWMTCCNF